jgi:hypothetical protein
MGIKMIEWLASGGAFIIALGFCLVVFLVYMLNRSSSTAYVMRNHPEGYRVIYCRRTGIPLRIERNDLI